MNVKLIVKYSFTPKRSCSWNSIRK